MTGLLVFLTILGLAAFGLYRAIFDIAHMVRARQRATALKKAQEQFMRLRAYLGKVVVIRCDGRVGRVVGLMTVARDPNGAPVFQLVVTSLDTVTTFVSEGEMRLAIESERLDFEGQES